MRRGASTSVLFLSSIYVVTGIRHTFATMIPLGREDDFHLPSLPPFEQLSSTFTSDPKSRFPPPSTHSLDTRFVLPLLAEFNGGTAPNPILDSLKSQTLSRSISPLEDEVVGKQQEISLRDELGDADVREVGSSSSIGEGTGIVSDE